MKRITFANIIFPLLLLSAYFSLDAQGTRLLRQPSMSDTHIAFTYGGDVWVTALSGGEAKRITSTSAVESDAHLAPDGKSIAFSSNRGGSNAVYIVSINGGDARRLTWHPAAAIVRGWSNDGKSILYATTRETAPNNYNRLWSISVDGGVPILLTKQWSFNGSFAPDGNAIVIDKMTRWDVEWRAYRGGQNTPLIILDLKTNKEVLLPHDKTTDIHPLWLGDHIYFLSDRDFISNIWDYNVKTKALNQITTFKGSDVKSLEGKGNTLIYERDGYIHTLDLTTKNTKQLNINVAGDFPWASTKWEDVSSAAKSASLSPNGKRIIVESRGDVFTVPAEFGNTRNISESSTAADRE